MPTLPKDIDVVQASLTVQMFRGDMYGVPVTAYALPREYHSPQDIITWNTIDTYLGRTFRSGLRSPEGTFALSWQPCTASGWPSSSLDVTSIIQDWVDRNGYYGYQGQGGRTTGPTILLRSPLEEDGHASTVEFFSPSLYISYMNLGWYMFQGNMKHTGYTQYGISPSAALQWKRSVPSPSDLTPWYQDPWSAGQLTPIVALAPSIVAVTNSANPTSNYPIIYTAITDNVSTRVYRFTDKGTTVNDSDAGQWTTINNFQAVGTPIVVPGTSATVPDKVFLVGIGTGNDDGKVKVYRLDALVSNGITTWTRPWTTSASGPSPDGARVIEGASTAVSPAYYSGNTYWWLENNGTSTRRSGSGGAIVLGVNTTLFSTQIGYMIALSISNGYNVWGHVDAAGNLVPHPADSGPWTTMYPDANTLGGLPPMKYTTTFSSPAIVSNVAYMNDTSCWNNARNLTDGSWAWEDAITTGQSEGSISITGGHLLHSENNGEISAMMLYSDDQHHSGSVLNEPPCWTTGAISPNNHAVIYGDDNGNLCSLITPWFGSGGISEQWNTRAWGSPASGQKIRCSPLVAGVPGTASDTVFFGADDQFLHVLDASTGSSASSAVLVGDGYDPGTGRPNPMIGPVRASLAAFRGRLYCVTMGRASGSFYPCLYCFQ